MLVFIAVAATIRAYNIETPFLTLFVRYVRSYLRVRPICHGTENTRLNRPFEERGAVAKNHVGMFSIFARGTAAVFAFVK